MNTEILLPVPELKQALGGLNKLVGRKTTLPVLSCIRITRKTDGMVQLQATDLNAHATFTLNDAQPGQALEVLVPLDQLNKASKCSRNDEAVALLCDDKTIKLRYCIGGSPIQQPVNSVPATEWPSCPEITAESTPLQPGFGEALKQAMACCSQDESRLILHGACLDARDAKAHYIVGTNGRFLYAANSFTFPLKEAVIIPDSKFLDGSSLLDESCSLALQTGKEASDIKHVCLSTKQWQFIARTIEGQYPNWKQVMPKVDGTWTQVKLSDTAIEQMLKVIPNLPGQDLPNHTVCLRTSDKGLGIEGRGKDDTEPTHVAIADVTINGKHKEIALDREFLLSALEFGLNELAILDELSPLVASRGGKRIVIMPVRPSSPAVQKPKTSQASASVPPAAEVKPVAEEQDKTVSKDTSPTTTPTPKSSEPSLLDQIEQVKESAKNLVRDLTGLTDIVKQAEREKRANEKEVETARAVLKKLQAVSL